MTNKTNRQQQSKQQPSIIIITLITCLGGVLSGYHQGVISVSLPSLKKEFHLTDTQEETVAGSLFLGGVFGCWLGGYICDYVGRKKAILTCDFVFILGSIITSTQRNSINQVLIGRGVTGFAVALSGISNVSYLTEMAPSNTSRGSIVSANVSKRNCCIAIYIIAKPKTCFIITGIINKFWFFISFLYWLHSSICIRIWI